MKTYWQKLGLYQFITTGLFLLYFAILTTVEYLGIKRYSGDIVWLVFVSVIFLIMLTVTKKEGPVIWVSLLPLLAAVFAMFSMRMTFGWLLLVWIASSVILVGGTFLAADRVVKGYRENHLDKRKAVFASIMQLIVIVVIMAAARKLLQ